MHIPDGFINLPTSAGAGLLSVAGVGIALKGAQRELDEKSAPLAGLTATFVFAVQMLNFPVAAGTSGHLLGGALAALLVGPYTASLAISMVLLIQGLLFADGGLSALGLNLFNMSIIGVWSSYFIFKALIKVLPKAKKFFLGASFVSALISVPCAALGFVVQYAIGGTATYSVSAVATAMVGTHILIGIGEGIITFFALSAVMSTRPDLIYLWKSHQPKLEIKA